MSDSAGYSNLMQFVLSGLAFGSIYAMVAIGFNIIYNATGIINLAQGEFVMLGGMFLVWGQDELGLPVWAAVAVSVLIVAAIGVAFERIAIRPLRNPSVLVLIIITIAGSFLFRGAVLLVWGDRLFSCDSFLSGDSIWILGAIITRQRILIFGTLLVVGGILAVFFGYTILGKAMRATAFNRTAARLVGINTRTMVMFAFGLSAAIGALAGAVVVPVTGIAWEHGVLLGLKGFAAAVLGGLGNNAAAVVAGLLLGVIESVAAGTISTDYKDAIALSALLIVLFIRPAGLFGRAELTRLGQL
ncbi:branched-chain amino acid ABC transporter permease [bacterium]|nr:branched-chain amino acid ABC transporter permease [bacterium]